MLEVKNIILMELRKILFIPEKICFHKIIQDIIVFFQGEILRP